MRNKCRLALFLAALVICGGARANPAVAQDGPRPFIDSARFVHVIKAERNLDTDQITVMLRIDAGYHINANPASLDNLLATALTFAGAAPVRIIYPPGIRFKPKFADEAIDVYEGTITIRAEFAKGTLRQTPSLGATLAVQACTDVICLPPAEMTVLY